MGICCEKDSIFSLRSNELNLLKIEKDIEVSVFESVSIK